MPQSIERAILWIKRYQSASLEESITAVKNQFNAIEAPQQHVDLVHAACKEGNIAKLPIVLVTNGGGSKALYDSISQQAFVILDCRGGTIFEIYHELGHLQHGDPQSDPYGFVQSTKSFLASMISGIGGYWAGKKNLEICKISSYVLRNNTCEYGLYH